MILLTFSQNSKNTLHLCNGKVRAGLNRAVVRSFFFKSDSQAK